MTLICYLGTYISFLNNSNKNIHNNYNKKNSRKSVGIYKKRNKSIKQHINFYFNNEKSRNTIKEHYPQIDTIYNNKNVNSNDVFNSKHHYHRKNDISYNFDDLNQASSKFVIQLKDDMDINFDEYLETELEKMEYYEAIKKDKRKFCTILCSNLRSNQLVINTFCMDEPLKPRPIKIKSERNCFDSSPILSYSTNRFMLFVLLRTSLWAVN